MTPSAADANRRGSSSKNRNELEGTPLRIKTTLTAAVAIAALAVASPALAEIRIGASLSVTGPASSSAIPL